MNEALIKSVRALAQAQKRYNALIVELRDNNIPMVRTKAQTALAEIFATQVDADALLAALERAERIEKAARELRFAQHHYDPRESPADVVINSARLTDATNALDAALSEPQ